MVHRSVRFASGRLPQPKGGEGELLGPWETAVLTSAGLSLIAACYGLARFAYGLFVPAFRAEFDLGAAAAGAIASGSYVSYCVAIVLATILTPRFGGRVLAVAAGAMATAGTLLIAAAPNAAVLAAGVVVAGSSTGVASPPLAHAVAHTVAEASRDRVQTVINAGTGIGVAVAGPVALLTHEHWRTAWLVFAVLCALVTVWVAATVPSGPASREAHESWKTLLPRPLLPVGSVELVAAAALLGASSAAVWTFGRDLLVTVGGHSESASLIAWVLIGVFGIVGAGAGDLGRRVGIRTGWLATMLVMAAATGLLAAFPGAVVLVWPAAAAFGGSYIALSGLLLVWGTQVYPQTPAAGVGLAFLMIALGQAAAAPVIGASSTAVGPQAVFLAAALVAVAGGFVRPGTSQDSRRSELV